MKFYLLLQHHYFTYENKKIPLGPGSIGPAF
jgi:hypothetical protein